MDKFLSGEIDLNTFGNELAKEYASLPVMTGKKAGLSYYEGKAKNTANVRPAEITAQLNSLYDSNQEAAADVVLSSLDPVYRVDSSQGSGIMGAGATSVDPLMTAIAASVVEAKKDDSQRSGLGNIMRAVEMLEAPQPMPDIPRGSLQVPASRRNPMARFGNMVSGGISSLRDMIGFGT